MKSKTLFASYPFTSANKRRHLARRTGRLGRLDMTLVGQNSAPKYPRILYCHTLVISYRSRSPRACLVCYVTLRFRPGQVRNIQVFSSISRILCHTLRGPSWSFLTKMDPPPTTRTHSCMFIFQTSLDQPFSCIHTMFCASLLPSKFSW